MPLPRIAIIGGGPAGLTLARTLHLSRIPFTIYERRSTSESQSLQSTQYPQSLSTSTPHSLQPTKTLKPTQQSKPTLSGSLELHHESGLKALRELNLFSQFEKKVRPGGEEMIITSAAGKLLHRDLGGDGEENARPEIDRNDLTDILLDSIPSKTIQYNHKLLSVVENPGHLSHSRNKDCGKGEEGVENGPSRWTLEFENGERKECDFVVGADGAWSRVRGLVTDVKPLYSGVQCMALTIRDIESAHPELARMVGGGTFWSVGEGTALLCQRIGHGAFRMMAAFPHADADFLRKCGVLEMMERDPKMVKRWLVEREEFFGGYGEGLKRLIGKAEEEVGGSGSVVSWPFWMLPVGQRWESRRGGDAGGGCGSLDDAICGGGG